MFAPFVRQGIGLHTGEPCGALVEMNLPGRGTVLLVGDEEIRVTVDAVSASSQRNTKVGPIHTVEHLFAALAMFGEVDVRVAVEGPEIPILDGSAAPWARALFEMGGEVAPRFVDVTREVSVTQGRSRARIEPMAPGQAPSIHVSIDFGHAQLGEQEIEFHPLSDDFVDQVAPARTFALASQAFDLRESGLARGGSLENAVVIGDRGPLNPEGLRFADEPVRHKLIDALGDLFLLGGLPFARVTLVKPGHDLLHELVRRAARFVAPRDQARATGAG